jgi:glycosyltransferase involved in cell wall biosynthesis
MAYFILHRPQRRPLFLTNEYPPAIYGGAGVHVDYLSRELDNLMEVDVRAFGEQVLDAHNLEVRGFPVDTSRFGCPKNLHSIFGAVTRCVTFKASGIDADTRDPRLRKRFGQAGRKRAEEKFTWQAIAHATKQMYSDLIDAHQRTD